MNFSWLMAIAKKISRVSIALVFFYCAFSLADAVANVTSLTANETPRELKDVGIQEHLGSPLDLSLEFKDEKGQTVKLGQFYDGTHPVVISLVYFGCGGLCSFHLNGVVDSLKKLDWSAGEKFQYLAISFDSNEGPMLAEEKKASYMKVYSRPGTEKGWHFLTADAATIAKLTDQIGFKFKWNTEAKEWAHASAAVVTTTDGKISRYLHGILFEPNTFRLSLSEATDGKIGTLVDRMVWFCFHYDPKQSKYTLYATRIMKVGGVAIILILSMILLPVWMRSRKENV